MKLGGFLKPCAHANTPAGPLLSRQRARIVAKKKDFSSMCVLVLTSELSMVFLPVRVV